jgi:hypothetical protein
MAPPAWCWVASKSLYITCVPAKVLKDWHGGSRILADGTPDPAHVLLWQQRARSFLKMGGGEGDTLKKRFKSAGQANVNSLAAFDNSMRLSTGLDCVDFVAASPPLPLKANQTRYTVPADQLPKEFAADLGFTQRVCISTALEDGTTTRCFCVNWTEERKILVTCGDRGNIGKPGKVWLFSACKLRGADFSDPAHVRYDHCKNSIHAAGLSDAFLEGKAVNSIRRGPHAGCAHMHLLHDVAINYVDTADYSDPLFQLCYPTMCKWYYEGKLPHDYGTVPHQQFMFSLIVACPLFVHSGSIDKASRWFEYHRLRNGGKKWDGFLMLITLRVGIEKDRPWYKTIDDTPLVSKDRGWPLAADDVDEKQQEADPSLGQGGASSSTADAAAGASAVADAPARKSAAEQAKDAKVQYEEKRVAANCQLDLVCRILCNESSMMAQRIILVFCQPSWAAHTHQSRMCSTQAGCVEWWAEVAGGKWEQTATDIMNLLVDKAAFAAIGFRMDEALGPEDEGYLQEKLLAEACFRLATELTDAEIGDMRLYSDFVPGIFGALVKEEYARPALTKCRLIQKALLELERQMNGAAPEDLCDFLKSFWNGLMFPDQPWPREVGFLLAFPGSL